MAEYRLYFLDEDGRVRRRMDIDQSDDAAAASVAELVWDGSPMELWRRDVRVKVFPKGAVRS